MRAIVRLFGIMLALLAALPAAAQTERRQADIVAQLTYQASATQAAYERRANARLRQLKGEIDTQDRQIAALRRSGARDRAALATAEAEVTRLKNRFAAALAAEDREYREDLGALTGAGRKLADSVRGREVLAQYLDGGPESWRAADRVLSEIQAERERIREGIMREARAEEYRERAELAKDARARGLATAAEELALRLKVVENAPDDASDWLSLSFVQDTVGDIAGQLESARRAVAIDDPNWQVIALSALSGALAEIGEYEEHLAQVERAVALQRAKVARRSRSNHEKTLLVFALNDLADAHHDMFEYERARTIARESVALARMLWEDEPSRSMSVYLSSALHTLADSLFLSESAAELGALLRERNELHRQWAEAEDPLMADLRRYASSLEDLAAYLVDSDSPAEAIPLLAESERLYGLSLAADPGDLSTRNSVGVLLTTRAEALHGLGRHEEELEAYEAGYAIDQELTAASPQSALYWDNRSLTEVDIAEWHWQHATGLDGLPYARLALESTRKAVADTSRRSRVRLASRLEDLAKLLRAPGPEESLALLIEAASIRQSVFDQYDTEVALGRLDTTLGQLFNAYYDAGRFAEAFEIQKRRVANLDRAFTADASDSNAAQLAFALTIEADAARKLGEYAHASSRFMRSMKLLERGYPPEGLAIDVGVRLLMAETLQRNAAMSLGPQADTEVLRIAHAMIGNAQLMVPEYSEVEIDDLPLESAASVRTIARIFYWHGKIDALRAEGGEEENFLRAIAMLEKLRAHGGTDAPLTMILENYWALAQAAKARGNLPQALDWARQAHTRLMEADTAEVSRLNLSLNTMSVLIKLGDESFTYDDVEAAIEEILSYPSQEFRRESLYETLRTERAAFEASTLQNAEPAQ